MTIEIRHLISGYYRLPGVLPFSGIPTPHSHEAKFSMWHSLSQQECRNWCHTWVERTKGHGQNGFENFADTCIVQVFFFWHYIICTSSGSQYA